MKRIIVILLSVLMIASIFTGCGSVQNGDIDENLLDNLEGEYRPTDDDLSWMILTIQEEGGPILGDSKEVPYLAIYDDEAGEPGVEGEIISLDEDTIIISINKDYFESLPDSDWTTTNLNSELEMHYIRSGSELILENNGKEIVFYDGSNGYRLDDNDDDEDQDGNDGDNQDDDD